MKTLLTILVAAGALLASEADWWAAILIAGAGMPFVVPILFEGRRKRACDNLETEGEA